MSSPPSFDTLRNKFTTPKTIQKPVKSSNIIDEMVSYDSDATNLLIQTLNQEYNDQLTINQILKDKNFEQNTNEIENFIKDNETNVSQQLSSLENIFTDLKNIHKENQELKDDQQEYKDLIHSEESKKISNDLRKLKSIQNNILLFLQKNGLHVPI